MSDVHENEVVEAATVNYDDLASEVREKIENAPNQRTKVEALIECGSFTKADMSTLLGLSIQSISTQMSYLRLGKKYTIYDESRVYSFCSEEEYAEWHAARKTKSKSKASTKSPKDQASALAKTMKRQNTQLTNLTAKAPEVREAANVDPENQITRDNAAEIDAKITILEISLRRGAAKMETLQALIDSEPNDGTETETEEHNESEEVIEESGDGEDLL